MFFDINDVMNLDYRTVCEKRFRWSNHVQVTEQRNTVNTEVTVLLSADSLQDREAHTAQSCITSASVILLFTLLGLQALSTTICTG